MTDILCPVCGKPNPSDLEVCQFCQSPLKPAASPPASPPAPPPGPEGGEELPDWLRGLRGEESGPEAEMPSWLSEPQPAEEAELPDWLADLKAAGKAGEEQPASESVSETAAPPEPEAPSPVLGAGEEPDWLTNLLGETRPEEQPTPLTPDWLAQGAQAEPETQPAQEPSAALPEDFSEWLASPVEKPAEAAEPPAGEPLEEHETPDWLKRLDVESSGKPSGRVPAFIFDEEEGETAAQPEAEKAAEDQFLSTLPDWVSQVSAETSEAEEPEEGNLAPAQLPGWLEAMRPVGAAVPTGPFEDLTSARVESAGPLAGLKGVLTAETDTMRPHKPAAFSIKLQVTDEQRARVALLEELLAAEQKSKPLPAQPILTPQYIFRLLIALALILPILGVVITAGQSIPLPAPGSLPGVLDMRLKIEALPANAPVLVAFDYEPGFSGEMDAAASAVIAHLARKGAYLALVSTSPTGPALAERFMANLSSLSPSVSYTNLGFIPGGAMGLLSLAQAPRQVLPYSLDGVDVWTNSPLEGVTALGDFRLLLVLTDDPDTARAWIEQVGGALKAKGTPLAMVTSAQAEPLVRPYYQGLPRQLDGLVSGIAGGAAYENAMGSPGPARLSWDAFSASLLVAFLTILVGAFVGVVSKILLKDTKKQKREQP